MDSSALWQRYRELLFDDEELGLRLDLSRMGLPAGYLEEQDEAMARAFAAMAELEAGAVANPDEGRRVGHYWLRAPELAPAPELAQSIRETVAAITRFAEGVHAARVKPPRGERFTDLLVVGIGGSALGPQLLADALGDPRSDALAVHFFDNTDPDGMTRTLDRLGPRLEQTLCVVISKSGGTPETRNGMLVAREALAEHGLDLAPQAVAITGEGSELDRLALTEGWLERFPMWPWVGGRTSITSAVGVLPAALQGLDVEALLRGAAACDRRTRVARTRDNPAALLALAWFHATGGKGERDMVILPYKDRLLLFSRYLQQLVMESLGKGRDLDGRPVEQGIAVYGNKGSTDQHAYVQQLREGVDNFFVTFVEVLEHGGADLEVEPGITCGDYLRGFLLGTREALREGGRPSMTLSLRRVDAFSLGVLIALYERAVGLYASLVNVNAYHQPGVEAGKKAAAGILEIQGLVFSELRSGPGARSAEDLARSLERPEAVETIFQLLEAAVANGRVVRHRGANLFASTYEVIQRG